MSYKFECNVNVPGFYTLVVEYQKSAFSDMKEKMRLIEIQGPIYSISLNKNEFKQSELQEIPLTLSKSSPVNLKLE